MQYKVYSAASPCTDFPQDHSPINIAVFQKGPDIFTQHFKCASCCQEGHAGSKTLLRKILHFLTGPVGYCRLCCIMVSSSSSSSSSSIVIVVAFLFVHVWILHCLVCWDLLRGRDWWSVSRRHRRLLASEQWTNEAACPTVWTATEENVCWLIITLTLDRYSYIFSAFRWIYLQSVKKLVIEIFCEMHSFTYVSTWNFGLVIYSFTL